jgi:hypothetical protein
MSEGRPLEVGLNAVIVAVTAERPRVLTVRRPAEAPPEQLPEPRDQGPAEALPFGPLDPDAHRTLELGLRSWVRQQTGLDLGYVEQLYTSGDRDRDPGGRGGERRLLSIGYLALVREQQAGGGGATGWRDIYDYFPWEDWRGGRPRLLEELIQPALGRWAAVGGGATGRSRRQRADIAFGLSGASWDAYRALERYELLYEAGLVLEAARDREGQVPRSRLGRPMVLDHRRILATALGRLRGKLKYRPVVFELLPASFTLLQLQRVVEALAGAPLHKQNFRRLVERGGLVEGIGELFRDTGGRPAELFRFRREVLRERPTPGVTLPRVDR